MDIKDLIAPEAVIELRAQDKRLVLNEMARRSAVAARLDADTVATTLLKREDLGSTGLGSGIALPHARIADLKRPFGLFARLNPAIPFDAIDEKPVDLVFLLLLPDESQNQQLKALAVVARRLRDPVLTGNLRAARGCDALYSLLTGVPADRFMIGPA